MHSYFLHGLNVTSHCEVLVNFSKSRRPGSSKAVKFALSALNEFNANTNFSPRTTVFLKKAVTGSSAKVVPRGKGEKASILT